MQKKSMAPECTISNSMFYRSPVESRNPINEGTIKNAAYKLAEGFLVGIENRDQNMSHEEMPKGLRFYEYNEK